MAIIAAITSLLPILDKWAERAFEAYQQAKVDAVVAAKAKRGTDADAELSADLNSIKAADVADTVAKAVQSPPSPRAP